MPKKHGATLSLRLPVRLREQLKKLADSEANNINAVARRLLAYGVAQTDSDTDGDRRRNRDE